MRIALPALLFALIASAVPAHAGTSGTLTGSVVDYVTGKPLAGAVVYVSSPAQVCKATTDASGNYVFVDLIPGSYTVSVELKDYLPEAVSGVPIAADFQQRLTLHPRHYLRTVIIDRFSRPRLSGSGITADVYSINRNVLPWYGLTANGIVDNLRFTPGVLIGPGVRMMP